jgi:parvulin-like peptidyl-prolyl isomerase
MRMQLSTEYKEKEVEGKIQSMKLDLLDRLIEDRLILQEAKRSKIKIDENRIKARIDEIKKNYTSDREFQNALARQGLVQADIESRIREQLLMHTIVEIKIKNKIIINPAEVTAFYEENREEFNLPEEREFESITVDNEDLAKEIYDKLRDGQDFQELAKNYSLAVNKSSTREGKLKDVVEAQIFKLHIGEYSSPIKIGDNHYIFKLDNIIPSRQQNLSEAQDNIYTFLFNKKMDAELALWLEDLKKHSYIRILQN